MDAEQVGIGREVKLPYAFESWNRLPVYHRRIAVGANHSLRSISQRYIGPGRKRLEAGKKEAILNESQ